MALPAGFSDEDEWDSDLEMFSNEQPSCKSFTAVQNILSSEERLVDAVINRNIEEVQALLEHENGVDVNYKPDKDGWPALMQAAFLCLCDIVELLLKHGADPKIHVKLTTPLMCLCSSYANEDQLLHCFDILLKAGAEINCYNSHRETPLMFAAERGHKKLVLRLLELGAYVNFVNCDGWSAIFYAISGSKAEMVQLLKDAGADISLVDVSGHSPYDVAEKMNHTELAALVSTDISSCNESYSCSTSISNYQFVCSEMPNYEISEFNGFHEDLMKTLRGLGMINLLPLFEEKKIGFGQFLVNKDEEWKKLGVKLSFDRKKLISYAYSIIQKSWSSEALVDHQEESDTFFRIAQKLSNNVRIVHILVATQHVCHRELNSDEFKSDSNNIDAALIKVLNEIKSLRSTISKMCVLMQNYENKSCKYPADYIGPNSASKILKCISQNKCRLYTWFLISCIGFSYVVLRKSWWLKLKSLH